MQCYEYLAIHHYARRHLGRWAEQLDDLELAEVLDEQQIHSFQDIARIES